LTNSLGNTYYKDKNELLQEAIQIHDQMLQKDSEFVAKSLPYARQRGYMRLQPIFGLAKLTEVNRELFKKIFNEGLF
jgi:60 kDa SS-A/Ro ribonucleoprotein